MQSNRYCNQKKSKACTACSNIKCEMNLNPVIKLNKSIQVTDKPNEVLKQFIILD